MTNSPKAGTVNALSDDFTASIKMHVHCKCKIIIANSKH